MKDKAHNDHLMNRDEVLEYLRCGRQKLQNMVNAGDFPARERNHGFWVRTKVEYAVLFGDWCIEKWEQWELKKLQTLQPI